MMASFTDTPESVKSTIDWSTGVLAPLVEKELENPAFTSTDRVNFYSDNASNYDSDMKRYSFKGPDVAAQALHDVLRDNYDAYILDVGCGTGKVLEEMQKFGPYINADGLEPAPGMLTIAKEKKLYKKYLEQFLFLNCGLEHNMYDGIVSSGTFVAGHMKSDCMIELCNVAKSGGYVVITMRHEHLQTVEEYRLHMRPTIEGLVSEGRWKIIKDELFADWCFGETGEGIDGHLFVFQKC